MAVSSSKGYRGLAGVGRTTKGFTSHFAFGWEVLSLCLDGHSHMHTIRLGQHAVAGGFDLIWMVCVRQRYSY